MTPDSVESLPGKQRPALEPGEDRGGPPGPHPDPHSAARPVESKHDAAGRS
jgi:hypothetical protein